MIPVLGWKEAKGRRPTSTKTRIETFIIPITHCYDIVEDQHPLKQGLKLLVWLELPRWEVVEDQHPLKQGLKL